ncbi:MAG: Maf family protein [Phycisphaeraceae bacterium]
MSEPSRDAPRLVLASRSPRRARLLREAGYAFVQLASPFDDAGVIDARAGDAAREVAVELALRKARALAATLEPGRVVLGADTLCMGVDGTLLGQPATREAAAAMLRGFRGRTHAMVTGVSLVVTGDGGRVDAFADRAEVTIGALPDAELEAYLDTEAWRGKAGGYNLVDRQAAGWPIEVAGDPTTVVGLPMARLAAALAKMGVGVGAGSQGSRGSQGSQGMRR